MSGPSAYPIVLSMPEQQRLEHRVRTATAQHRHVLRAMIILLAAQGWSNAAITRRVGVCVDTAGDLAQPLRFLRRGRPAGSGRSGRPRRFTEVQQAQVTAIACELPADRGIPLSRFSHADLAAEAVDVGVVEDISASTVRRWLRRDAIRPGATNRGSSP